MLSDVGRKYGLKQRSISNSKNVVSQVSHILLLGCGLPYYSFISYYSIYPKNVVLKIGHIMGGCGSSYYSFNHQTQVSQVLNSITLLNRFYSICCWVGLILYSNGSNQYYIQEFIKSVTKGLGSLDYGCGSELRRCRNHISSITYYIIFNSICCWVGLAVINGNNYSFCLYFICLYFIKIMGLLGLYCLGWLQTNQIWYFFEEIFCFIYSVWNCDYIFWKRVFIIFFIIICLI